ncbi:hypothetical protein [Methylobacterium nigriterrae]|uniref:hypothetical protein n=1 Tax=Methylobacterium nigriterrae TaxID=3127512 RepID=UPI003013DFD9
MLADLPDPAELEAPARYRLLAWAARVSLVAIVVACAGAHYLTHLDLTHLVARPRGADPIVQAAARALPDPETTGAIGAAARSVNLDPCTVIRRLAGSGA